MKDAVHHLKYVQKKVIQSVRRSENSTKSRALNGTEVGKNFGFTEQGLEREKKRSGSS